jgi:DNA-binding CsgD family transcriptional regulator
VIATALDLRTNRWLFVDQALIEAAGIALRLHTPVRRETVWTPQRPWESGATQRGEASFTMLRDRPRRLAPLTPREGEVAALVATGLSNREIAVRVHVTERTAENHVEHILNKLGVHSCTQMATRVAHQAGLWPEGRKVRASTLPAPTNVSNSLDRPGGYAPGPSPRPR